MPLIVTDPIRCALALRHRALCPEDGDEIRWASTESQELPNFVDCDLLADREFYGYDRERVD